MLISAAGWLGDYPRNYTTVACPFSTVAADGSPIAPSEAFDASDIKIYRGGSETPRASTSGITVTSPHATVTGRHMVVIDLSDNDDDGFYQYGGVFSVFLETAKTVDGKAVDRCIGQFGMVLGLSSGVFLESEYEDELVGEIASTVGAGVAVAVWDKGASEHVTGGTMGWLLGMNFDINSNVNTLLSTTPSAEAVADAVWQEPIADHEGTEGSTAAALAGAGGGGGGGGATPEEIRDAVWAAASRTLTAGTNLNDLDAAGIRAAVGLAAANLDTQIAALPTALQNADALLNRDMSAVTVTNPRSPINALRFLRNKWTLVGTTLTVMREDDTTPAWAAVVTATAGVNPITAADPA